MRRIIPDILRRKSYVKGYYGYRGSRSGKSVIAEQKAKEYGKRSVLYLATAIPIDDDMKERIRMHQERRDPNGELMKDTAILVRL